jgi:hypothetical protein
MSKLRPAHRSRIGYPNYAIRHFIQVSDLLDISSVYSISRFDSRVHIKTLYSKVTIPG